MPISNRKVYTKRLTGHGVKAELVSLKQCNVIWLNRENLALRVSDW